MIKISLLLCLTFSLHGLANVPSREENSVNTRHERTSYASYHSISRSERRSYNIHRLGTKMQELAMEFQHLTRELELGPEVFDRYLTVLTEAAKRVQSHDARDTRGAAKKNAEALVDAIESVAPMLESDVLLMNARLNRLGVDLQMIKQDIIDKYIE